MKKAILLLGVLLSGIVFTQTKKMELTKEEISFIASNKAGGLFSTPKEKETNEIIALNNTIYMFEISNNGNVLFRETFRRWSPYGSLYNQSTRTKLPVCFRYNDLSADLILSLLEDSKWKVEKTGQSKFLCLDEFSIFNESNNKEPIINKLEGFDIKVYKLVD